MQNHSDNTLPLYHVAPVRYFRKYRCWHHFISLAYDYLERASCYIWIDSKQLKSLWNFVPDECFSSLRVQAVIGFQYCKIAEWQKPQQDHFEFLNTRGTKVFCVVDLEFLGIINFAMTSQYRTNIFVAQSETELFIWFNYSKQRFLYWTLELKFYNREVGAVEESLN